MHSLSMVVTMVTKQKQSQNKRKILISLFLKQKNMFRGENSHSLSYEQQAKFIQDRITNVEKNFGDLCVAFGDYARKTGRLVIFLLNINGSYYLNKMCQRYIA